MLKMGFNTMSPAQVREYQSLGGRVTQTRRRRKKLLLEVATDILNQGLQKDSEIRQHLKDGGLDDQDINYAAAILIIQVQKALGGDTRAAEFIRDTSGQNPTNSTLVVAEARRSFEKADYTAMAEAQLKEIIEQKEDER